MIKFAPTILFKYTGICFLLSACLFVSSFCLHDNDNSNFVPWQSVGGCGVWTINKTPPAFTAPVWSSNIRPDYRFYIQGYSDKQFSQTANWTNFEPKVTGFINRRLSFGLTVPILYLKDEVQYRTNQSATNYVSGGFGDMAVDGAFAFFNDNPFAIRLTVQFPTGDFNLKRGPEAASEYLPTSLQKGTGIYVLAISVDHERKMFDKGLWNLRSGFIFPFNIKLFSGENQFLSSTLSEYSDETDNKRFYYRFKPYGENDIGRYVPPEFLLSWHYSHIPNKVFRHTWATQFSFPFGVNWIPNTNTEIYDPRPDPDNRMWRSEWLYMPEVRIKAVSAMCFLALPLNDKADSGNPDNEYDASAYSKFNGAAWSNFLQEWKIGIGIRLGLIKFK
jgi:hypothetical protein